MKTPIVIFTDLDGTLLDHDNYSYTAALPAFDYIKKNNIPLIFTTSKTSVEIEELCNQIDFYHPFIAENGGLLAVPDDYFSTEQSSKKYKKNIIGVARKEIDSILKNLSTIYKFKSFHDMSVDELVEHTGLKPNQAKYANQGDSTEPLLWLDEPTALSDFTNDLKKHNLNLITGGRFHHVMGNHDKSTTMTTLLDMYKDFWNKEVISVALGDSPNDFEMLHTANHGIVIPNPHAPKMCIDNHVNLIKAEHSGPQGWNDSLLALLKELNKGV